MQKVKVKAVTAESAHVTWKAPKSDGGAPISAYHVLKQQVGVDEGLVAACDVAADVTECSVQALEANAEYKFAVVAENEVGQGEKSKPSDVTKTKPKICTRNFTNFI